MDILSIRQIRQATTEFACPAIVHVQVERATVKPTKSGSEFLELKLTDASDQLILRVWGDAQYELITGIRQFQLEEFGATFRRLYGGPLHLHMDYRRAGEFGGGLTDLADAENIHIRPSWGHFFF